MRYDLIGPRPLRPAVSKSPQPVLVVSILDTLSKADVELFIAVRQHVDCLSKALKGKEAAEAWEKFEAPKRKGEMPTGLHQIAKFSKQWQGPKGNAPTVRHADINTPEHDHARLVAKRIYLQDKIQGHANAGHESSHPMLQHRQRVLGQVEDKLQSYAKRGVSSGPQHHKDWTMHYTSNPHGSHSDDHISIGTTYHNRAQNPTPSPQQKELYQKTASPEQTGAKVEESHIDVTGKFSPIPHPHEAATGVAPIGSTSAGTALAKPVSTTGPKGTEVVKTPHVAKSTDKWISDKISLLVREGKPQKQAIAIALDMAGRAKKSVPLLLSV